MNDEQGREWFWEGETFRPKGHVRCIVCQGRGRLPDDDFPEGSSTFPTTRCSYCDGIGWRREDSDE